MKVIMLKDVKGVGQRDTVQDVSDGYGQNFLIAQGMAQEATKQRLAELEARKSRQSAATAQQAADWAALAKRIESASISVLARANSTGHLYEQLSPALIVEAIEKQLHTRIPPESIVLNAPVKQIGETTVALRLGTKSVKFTVNVIAAA